MSRALLALTLLAAVGAAGWWKLAQSSDDAPAPLAASPKAKQTPPAPPTTPPGVELPADDPNTSAEERSALAAPPPPPEPQGIEDGESAAPVQGDFSSKYEDFEPRLLRETLQQLESQLQRELDDAILPRFAEGRFEEHAISRDERRSVTDVLAEHTKGNPLCRAWPVFDPAGASNPTAQQNLIAVRVVCLDPSEHASLATLSDECAWLRAHAGVR